MEAISLQHRVAIPSPKPASIAYSDDGIWVADVEKSVVLLIDYKTGSVIKSVKSIVKRPQTISWDGKYLWEYDEETSNLYKHNLSNGPSFRFGKVEGINTPYFGLAYTKQTLWLLCPDQPEFTVSNNHITVIDFPRNIHSETFEAPSYSCRGLFHDGRYLWTLDVELGEIFALDPYNGIIINSYALHEVDSPSSLVIGKKHVWTLNLRTNELLTFSLNRNQTYTISGGRHSDVELVYTLKNSGPGTLKKIELFNSLPGKYLNQRLYHEPVSNPPADELLLSQWDEGDGQVLLHRIKDLSPGEEKQIRISLGIDTINVKYHIFPHKAGTLQDIPPKIKNKYLFSELLKNEDKELREVVKKAQLLFQTGEKEIREKVKEIIQGETNTFWIARLLYNYVVDTIKYVLPYTSISSRRILKQGKGSCGNHATIFIAFCQVAGLPSRSIIGFSIWKNDSRLGYLDHEIPEVYFPGYGWIPVDTSRFMSLPIQGTTPLTKFRSFATLSDRFFVNGFGRDLSSPFARKRHSEERLCQIGEKPCDPDLRFFMRWTSQPLKDISKFN